MEHEDGITRGSRWALLAVLAAVALAVPLLTAPVPPVVAAPRALAADSVAIAMARAASVAAVPVSDLRVSATVPLGDGATAVRLQQVRAGIDVYAGELVVALDATGAVQSVTGEVTRSREDPVLTVSAATAQAAARAAAAARHPAQHAGLVAGEPASYLYDPILVGARDTGVRAVWRVGVVGPRTSGIAVEVLVDGRSGAVVSARDVDEGLARSICDIRDDATSVIAAGSWCTEDDPDGYRLAVVDATNPIALKAYDALGHTAAFYADVLGVDLTQLVGLDTQRPYPQRLTPQLTATVRFCERGQKCPYYNAIWTDSDPFFVPASGRTYPGGQLFLGSGFERSLDVTAHELTHGVVSATSGLRYYGQSGAINESVADVFGQLAQLYEPTARTFYGSRDSGWFLGEQLPRGPVRSMSKPASTSLGGGPQPDRMTSRWWATGPADAGGVHTNSGVGNKTAFLLARGGRFGGRTVRGVGERATARVFWRAQFLLTSGSNYRDLAEALALACGSLYGRSSGTCTSVRRATAATGVGASKVSVKVSSTKVRPGRTVKVRAQLRGARGGELTLRGGPRPKLVLTRRYLGTKRWVTVRSSTASVHGKKTWWVEVRRSAVYKVRYPGSVARGLAAASTTKVVRVR